MFSAKRFNSRRPSQAAALQALEPRRLFATSAVIENGILTITGTDTRQSILIDIPGHVPGGVSSNPIITHPGQTPPDPTEFTTASGLLEVNFGDSTPIASFDPADIRRIVVRAGAGDDDIAFRGASLPKKIKFDIQGGDGIDSLVDTHSTNPKAITKPSSTIEIIKNRNTVQVGDVKATAKKDVLTFTGSSAADDIDFRNWGAFFVDSGLAFTINGTKTFFTGSFSKVVIKSGGGDDLIRVDNPYVPSTFSITVNGGAGKDTLEQSSDILASRVEITNTVPRLNQT